MKEEWEEIPVETTPPGAKVSISNGMTCHTPCHLEFERGKVYELKISKDGYKSETLKLNGRSIDGWVWGNLVFLVGLPVGIAIDFYTGYAFDFSPGKIEKELKKP
jgi:hypothetical protein